MKHRHSLQARILWLTNRVIKMKLCGKTTLPVISMWTAKAIHSDSSFNWASGTIRSLCYALESFPLRVRAFSCAPAKSHLYLRLILLDWAWVSIGCSVFKGCNDDLWPYTDHWGAPSPLNTGGIVGMTGLWVASFCFSRDYFLSDDWNLKNDWV